MQYDFSICIPARNEEFLAETIKNIVKNKRGKTEVIAVLDGYKPETEIEEHPDIRVIHLDESIGQRAAQNLAIQSSNAKYVAKTDGHVAFSEGFDVELMKTFEELGDNIVVAPLMKNLWAFDWKCLKCGSRWYQGPIPTRCMKRGRKLHEMSPNEDCDNTTDFKKKTVFQPRPDSPNSTSYRFDSDLHFQYFDQYKAKQVGDLVESMSLQGSFLMMTKERYLDLNISDENWGSWGSQGSETALKVWLSGGRVIINKRCWYAHLFRTQPGFSFPYPQNGNSQQRARDICNDIFKNNKWDKAIHQLPWLLEKFWPVPGWSQDDLEALGRPKPISREIIYYSAHQKPLKIAGACQKKLREISAQKDIPIRSVTLKPMDKMGENICLPLEPGKLTYFMQIITALRTSTAEIVYMTEDDVLYHESHFDYIPGDDKFHYDVNWWKIRMDDGFAASWEAAQVSGLVARREPLLAWYRDKLDNIMKKGFDRRYEPGGRHDEQRVMWKAAAPHIDIRVGGAMTASKWDISDFRDKSTAVNFETSTIENINGWGYDELRELIEN